MKKRNACSDAVLRNMNRALLGVVLFVLPGCALHPPGELEERARAEDALKELADKASAVELSANPTVEEYLRYAFFHNAEIQARYWEWRAAIEQIPQDASPPNPALSFEYMFSSENMKTWDRTTTEVMNDPMGNIPAPSKLRTAGKRALEAASAAGRRFEGAKFVLQGQVLSSYHDLALLAESIRIGGENAALLRLILSQASVRVQAGVSAQQDLLKAQTELDLAENELENLKSQTAPVAAKFNSLLGRAANAPVPLPSALPAARPLTASDAELIQTAAERSPELQALAHEIAGEEQALSLARQAYIPDFGLSLGFTGSVSQSVGGMLTMPLRLEAIRAGIEQARAGIRAAQAARLQYERDLAASFVLNLAVLRNDERQVALFEKTIIPRARQTVEIAQNAYAANRVDFGELLEAQRVLIDTRLTAAQLRTEREKALAAIETRAAVDVEVMGLRSLRRGGMNNAPGAKRAAGAERSSAGGAGSSMGGM